MCHPNYCLRLNQWLFPFRSGDLPFDFGCTHTGQVVHRCSVSGAVAPGSFLLFLFLPPCGFQLAVPITGASLIPLVSKPTLPCQSAAAATAAAAPLSRSHCSHTACRAGEGKQEKQEIVTERKEKMVETSAGDGGAIAAEGEERVDGRSGLTEVGEESSCDIFYSEKAATIYNCIIERGAEAVSARRGVAASRMWGNLARDTAAAPRTATLSAPNVPHHFY